MFLRKRDVVFVDEGCAGRGTKNAECDGDEHQPCGACGIAFSFLVDDREGHKEHVEEAVEDGHVDGDEEDD